MSAEEWWRPSLVHGLLFSVQRLQAEMGKSCLQNEDVQISSTDSFYRWRR